MIQGTKMSSIASRGQQETMNFSIRVALLVMISCQTSVSIRMDQQQQQHTNSILSTFQYPSLERCTSGAPPQWRKHLDAASKAHLAPVVALGTLRHLNLTPIQLQSHQGSYSSRLPQQVLVYHLQNIHNAGVTIEATFTVSNIFKKPATMNNLKPMQDVRLFYHVGASLSTTSKLITLANSGNSTGSLRGSSALQVRGQLMHPSRLMRLNGDSSLAPCALELSENELVKRVNKLFKLDQNYIIFLDQYQASQIPNQLAISRSNPSSHSFHHKLPQAPPIQPYQPGLYRAQHPYQTNPLSPQKADPLALDLGSLHPFASHELLTNQTSRSVSRILCKDCGKYRDEIDRCS